MFHEMILLKWAHILAMVYWLGGEWGVFQTSYNVINRKLALDERRRHMETAYRIDILARSGIILLLPLGLHLGFLWGRQPFGGGWLVLFWVLGLSWLALCWAAFIKRETATGIRLTKIDEAVRFVLIPLLMICAISSLLGHGPFIAGEGGMWYSTKVPQAGAGPGSGGGSHPGSFDPGRPQPGLPVLDRHRQRVPDRRGQVVLRTATPWKPPCGPSPTCWSSATGSAPTWPCTT